VGSEELIILDGHVRAWEGEEIERKFTKSKIFTKKRVELVIKITRKGFEQENYREEL
jgi:hypothetical protein